MAKPPQTRVESPTTAAAQHGNRLLPPARYRHPGDIIRLILAVAPGWLCWRVLQRKEYV
jgi:hypothetical protein